MNNRRCFYHSYIIQEIEGFRSSVPGTRDKYQIVFIILYPLISFIHKELLEMNDKKVKYKKE